MAGSHPLPGKDHVLAQTEVFQPRTHALGAPLAKGGAGVTGEQENGMALLVGELEAASEHNGASQERELYFKPSPSRDVATQKSLQHAFAVDSRVSCGNTWCEFRLCRDCEHGPVMGSSGGCVYVPSVRLRGTCATSPES